MKKPESPRDITKEPLFWPLTLLFGLCFFSWFLVRCSAEPDLTLHPTTRLYERSWNFQLAISTPVFALLAAVAVLRSWRLVQAGVYRWRERGSSR